MNVRIAHLVESTRAEGPGLRLALWFQGCPLRCPGCCNPEMLSFRGGVETDIDDLLARIETAQKRYGIEGITLLGGEPFAHAEGATEIAEGAQRIGLSVMIFSGFYLDQLREQEDPIVDSLLLNTDILVDGPYKKEQPDSSRRWIGSANQQIHFLSQRYAAEDACWQKSDTLEIRLRDGEVMINGFPAVGAESLWKRPKA